MYEHFGCSASWSCISQLLLQSLSVLLFFVYRGLPCSSRCYISIEPTVLKCCADWKHLSVPNQHNPFLDRCGSPRIPRATNSLPIVGIIQCPRSASLIRCDFYIIFLTVSWIGICENKKVVPSSDKHAYRCLFSKWYQMVCRANYFSMKMILLPLVNIITPKVTLIVIWFVIITYFKANIAA